jgi:hypothetical protein
MAVIEMEGFALFPTTGATTRGAAQSNSRFPSAASDGSQNLRRPYAGSLPTGTTSPARSLPSTAAAAAGCPERIACLSGLLAQRSCDTRRGLFT